MTKLDNVNSMISMLDRYIGTFDWGSLTKSKQIILNSFLRVATSEGIANVSMRTLASAAGVKPPTIYSHFPGGRDEIVSAALHRHYNNFSKSLRQALHGCTCAEEYWASLVAFHVTQQLSQPENDLWDILIATDKVNSSLDPELRREVNDWEEFCDQMYCAVARDLGHANCTQDARVVRKTLDSIGSWWHWDGSEAHLNQAIDYALVLTTHILTTPKTVYHKA